MFIRFMSYFHALYAHVPLTPAEQVACEISNEGAKFLAELLKNHTSLLKLILVRHCAISFVFCLKLCVVCARS